MLRFSTAYSKERVKAGELDHCSLGDTFLLPWKKSRFYAFSPMSLILRVLNKIKQHKARVILVVPT